MSRPFEWSFRNHVEPMLAKLGCNSGPATAPRRARGLPAFAPRLRSGDRLLQHRQARSRPSRRALRPGPQPGARQALRRNRAQRRHPVRDQLARLPHPRRMVERRRGSSQRQTTRASSNWKSCPPARSTTSARASRSWSAPATRTAGRKTSPARSNGRPPTRRSAASTTRARPQIIGPGEGAVVAWYSSRLAIARITVPYESKPPAKRRDRRQPQAAQLHRRTGRQAARAAQSARFAGLHRRRIRAPRLRRHDRPAARSRRGPGFPRRQLANQARCADRKPAQAARVRRLLDLQMVRLADAQRHAAAPRGAQDVLSMDPQASGRRTSRGTSSSARSSRPPARASRTAPPTSTHSASRPRT